MTVVAPSSPAFTSPSAEAATAAPPGEIPPALRAEIRALSLWLRDQSERIEAGRRIPDDVVARLHDAGLFRMTLPQRLGGMAMPPHAVWQLVYEVARGSGSAAWLVSLCLANTIMLARFPDRLQDELFGAGPRVIVSALTGAAPRGLAVENIDGGILLSGQWGYASGIDVADWVGVLVPVGPAGEVHFALLPQADFAIDANSWNVIGMRGTGSKDVSLSRTFVPRHRLVPWKPMQDGQRHPDCSAVDALQDYPLNALFAMSILAPSLGLACAIVDEFRAMAGRRLAAMPAGQREPFITTELAQADACITMACDSLVFEASKPLLQPGPASAQMRAEMRVRLSMIASAARAASQRLFAAAGGQVMPSGSRFETLLRDMSAMYSHLLLQPQPISETCGRLQLGMDMLPGSRI
ncbi:MAG: acyl-CoA dehydrogenase family protein [Pseudomonadota bacterium]